MKGAGPTSRSVARDALVRVENGAYSHIVVPELLRASPLDDRDRAFVTALVYGTLRRRRRLDAVIDRFGRRRVDDLDPPVRAALRMGVAQLLDGVASHAAVSATVDATPARARGYVNAVLRAAAAGLPWAEPHSVAVALSYPDWLVERLTTDLGSDVALDALAASNAPAATTFRPNPARTTAGALAAELISGGADAERGRLVRDAVRARGIGDPARLPAVIEGRATPQDEGSQAVVGVLGAEPGDRVLDVAAAPGGKATAVAERVGAGGLVVATDVHPGRTRLVTAAARRLGLSWIAPVVADGRWLPARQEHFDRVLVDAPCSGLGVLRRRPEARWRITPEAIEPLADLQVALVLASARTVRPGGLLLYSVCTLTAAETMGVAERVTWELGTAFTPMPAPPAPWQRAGGGALLLPQVFGTDGMFVVGWRRVDTTIGRVRCPRRPGG